MTCDICGKVYVGPFGLRTIQIRDTEHDIIATYVCCAESCADRLRGQKNQIVLSDEPTRGELGPQGYI